MDFASGFPASGAHSCCAMWSLCFGERVKSVSWSVIWRDSVSKGRKQISERLLLSVSHTLSFSFCLLIIGQLDRVHPLA